MLTPAKGQSQRKTPFEPEVGATLPKAFTGVRGMLSMPPALGYEGTCHGESLVEATSYSQAMHPN